MFRVRVGNVACTSPACPRYAKQPCFFGGTLSLGVKKVLLSITFGPALVFVACFGDFWFDVSNLV